MCFYSPDVQRRIVAGESAVQRLHYVDLYVYGVFAGGAVIDTAEMMEFDLVDVVANGRTSLRTVKRLII